MEPTHIPFRDSDPPFESATRPVPSRVFPVSSVVGRDAEPRAREHASRGPRAPHATDGPAELGKAEELFATFEPAKMSLDAHADAKIEEWRVRDPEDAVFLRQVLYGVTRYARFLGVVVRAFMHHNAATVLRRDKNTYTMYAYLALLRLDELGFRSFRCAFGWMAPSNTISRGVFSPSFVRAAGSRPPLRTPT